MPCNCSAITIGITGPFANQKDVQEAFNQVATCCKGSISSGTDPIASPSVATNEGFPDGLQTDCACDVLWLTWPDKTLFVSGDQGSTWYMVFNGGTVFGVLLDDADPNDGGAAFSAVPQTVDGQHPSFAYDSLGNVWATFDRGTSWLQIYQPARFAQVVGTSSLVTCNDGVATVMTGGAVTDGDTSWYNPVTGEVTVPISGHYDVKHRIEFGPGALISGGVIQAELIVNGSTVMRESQVFGAAHGNVSYEVSVMGGQQAYLDAGDTVQYRITIAGSGNETPWYFGMFLKLSERA